MMLDNEINKGYNDGGIAFYSATLSWEVEARTQEYSDIVECINDAHYIQKIYEECGYVFDSCEVITTTHYAFLWFKPEEKYRLVLQFKKTKEGEKSK